MLNYSKIFRSLMILSSPLPFALLVFISLIGISLAVHAQYTYSKSPKKTTPPQKNIALSDASFIDLANTIPIKDSQTHEIWRRLLEAVQDGACSSHLFLEMLGTLEGRPGNAGFNELSLATLDWEGGDPNTVSLYYLRYGKDVILCPKKTLLDAFHALELELQKKGIPV